MIDRKHPHPQAVALLLTAFALLMPASLRAQDDPDPARFAQEIEAFEQGDRKNAVPSRPILFVGSSSIRFWSTAERFPGHPVINRGFGGSHISDVNHYLARIVLKYAPRAIVYYAGDNDIADGKTPAQVVEDYRTFVERVHATLPETRIFFIPIKPSLSRWTMWPRMAGANAAIRAYSETQALLYYVDTATPMLGEDGSPRPGLFIEDGLHLSAAGYDLWTDILKPYLEKMHQDSMK